MAQHRVSSEELAAATDQIVELYTAGVAMQTIVDRTGIGRTSIRKVLLAAGVSRRPTGRPRIALSSQAVADLYESGLTMTEVAARLKIRPATAWPRYLEVRDQRGVTPGRWHQVLLDRLEKHPAVLVVAAAARELRRAPTTTEAHAVRRAARELARVGVADIGHVTVTWGRGERLIPPPWPRVGVLAQRSAWGTPFAGLSRPLSVPDRAHRAGILSWRPRGGGTPPSDVPPPHRCWAYPVSVTVVPGFRVVADLVT